MTLAGQPLGDDRHDARVPHRRQRADLPAQRRERAVAEAGDRLQRDAAAGARIARAVDLAHGAAAEASDDLEAADGGGWRARDHGMCSGPPHQPVPS